MAEKVMLRDLHPAFAKSGDYYYISFDCPCEDPDCGRRIIDLPCITNGTEGQGLFWQMEGKPPDWDHLTLHPNINYHNGHWHGFVTNGEVK